MKKANILNGQFTSVFTEEELSTVPELNSTDHLSVQSIVANRKGMSKLLRGTNPHMAIGPDEIHGRLLKTLSDEEVEFSVWFCLGIARSRQDPQSMEAGIHISNL